MVSHRIPELRNQDCLFETREDLFHVIRCCRSAPPFTFRPLTPYHISSLQQANHFIDFRRHVAGRTRGGKRSNGRCVVGR